MVGRRRLTPATGGRTSSTWGRASGRGSAPPRAPGPPEGAIRSPRAGRRRLTPATGGRTSSTWGRASGRGSAPPRAPGPPEGAIRLPDGWAEAFDPGHGRAYFFNVGTGERTWERPAAAAPYPQSGPFSPAPEFDGHRAGCFFGTGAQGTGYYRAAPPPGGALGP